MYSSLNHIPLLRLLCFFIAGIISAIYLPLENSLLFLIFAITLISFFGLLTVKKINRNYKLRWLFAMSIYLSMLLAGACLTNLKYQNTIELINVDNQLLIAEITAPVQNKENSIKAIVNIKGIKSQNNWTQRAGKAIIYFQKEDRSQQLNIGDIISFEPKLENVSPPQNPNEFNFKRYLSFHLIHQQAYLHSNNWRLIKQSEGNSIFEVADKCRNYFIQSLEKKGIKGKELAVASALILGYKDDIDPQLKSAYSSAGAMHILAVSGLHVGIIFLIFNQFFLFFDKIKYGNIIKGLLLILVIWAYALLTGLSPSVLRAATMFSFIVAAKIIKRNSNFFNTLAASALVLLIYNPLLIMEVGFQLSYLAVTGIVIIQPWINNWLSFQRWFPRKIWEITSVSIAAQIATFPLGLLYFHQFPNYFLLSNLIVIPLAILILSIGILTLSFSFIPILSDYLATLLNYIIQFLNYSVKTIDKLPYSLSENIRFTVIETWFIYLFIVCIILLIVYRKFKYMFIGSIFLILFFFSSLIQNYNDLGQRKLIIYKIPKHSAINFINGNENILISDSELIKDRKKLMFHVQNNWINNGLNKEKIIQLDQLEDINTTNLLIRNNYIQFYNHKIAVIDNNFKLTIRDKRLDLDLLILTNYNQLSIHEILTVFKPKQIVLDASISSYKSKELKKDAELLGIECWSVLLDGAYVKKLRHIN